VTVAGDEAAAREQALLIGASFPSLDPEVLGGEELGRVEPAVGPDPCVPRGHRPPRGSGASTCTQATLGRARGVGIRLGRAASLEVADDAVTGVRVNGEPVAGGAVLVAAGLASALMVTDLI
jgi:glycine/D-amino acid oxidase-like deaminating enzyme